MLLQQHKSPPPPSPVSSLACARITYEPGALNVAVVDDLTMTCQISITATAAVGARSVTVKAGSGLSPCQHTLVNGFTIT